MCSKVAVVAVAKPVKSKFDLWMQTQKSRPEGGILLICTYHALTKFFYSEASMQVIDKLVATGGLEPPTPAL